MEKKYPANILLTRKKEIDNITSLPGGSVWVDDTTNVNRIFDGRLSYIKGSHILYMLRWILGDELFLKSLQQYLIDPAVSFGFASTDDLKRNLEKVSGKDLNEFFKDWFYAQGYPSYNIEWNQLGSEYAKIKISQTTSHQSVNFFEMPVALLFKNAFQQKTVIIENKSNGEIFFKKIGFMADTVLVDPEYWLITKNNTSKKIIDSASGQNIIQVFPNPLQGQLFVYMRNLADANALISIYNTAGQLMYQKGITTYNNSYFQEIGTAGYAHGAYFIKIQSGNKTIFVKEIIK
jgi:aminopeptidase N